MNIDSLPAGREMDALIAEKVMGWEIGNNYKVFGGIPPSHSKSNLKLLLDIPHYSTDIAAAWKVVEKLDYKSHYHFTLYTIGAMWFCSFDFKEGERYQALHNVLEAKENTAPLAICRAALKAINNNP